MAGSKERMMTISFPLLCAVFIFNLKLFVFKVYLATKSYSAHVKENNFVISGKVGDIKRALVVG